jgi:RNA polymerase sigma-70 factor, ECF subfamily
VPKSSHLRAGKKIALNLDAPLCNPCRGLSRNLNKEPPPHRNPKANPSTQKKNPQEVQSVTNSIEVRSSKRKFSSLDWKDTLGNSGRLGDSLEHQPFDPESSIRLATFEQYRGLLFSIAYRMLGSVADAEDMLQETFIRWQQKRDDDKIRSPRAFLVTITSRLCVNQLQSARALREEYVGEWLPEPIITDPESDPLRLIKIDESLSMAFLVLLERLTPIERAVFLLREVFEYDYAEVAAILGHSESNCRQILRRARQHVSAMRPRFKMSERKKRNLLERFLEASTSGNMEGLIALLAGDVVLKSDGGGKGIAVPNVVRGLDNVARGTVGSFQKLLPKNLVHRLASINGELGIISYLDAKPFSVLTIDADEEKIRTIYVLTNPGKLSRLPELLDIPQ